MIKHSHRGLIENGKLPSIYYSLYILISVVFYSQWLLIVCFRITYSQSYKDEIDEAVLKTFGKGPIVKIPDIRFTYYHYFVISMCIFLMLLLIMSLGIFYTKSKLKKPTHYRQNVFTLNLTLFWGLLHFGLFISNYLTLVLKEPFILSVLRFFMIIFPFMKSIVTIFETQKSFPELFSDMCTDKRSFSFNLTNVYPRQQNLMPFIPFQKNAR